MVIAGAVDDYTKRMPIAAPHNSISRQSQFSWVRQAARTPSSGHSTQGVARHLTVFSGTAVLLHRHSAAAGRNL